MGFIRQVPLHRRRNPGRALIHASGTPITNTFGEMSTLQRFQASEALSERGIHEFDAWASTFGDTRTELELQPSGAYKPVERFSEFVNVPELIDMFRSVADVVLKADLRQYLKLPAAEGGQRQIITAPASEAFRDYQSMLAERITAIEERTRRAQKGDDILLSVITDGRHAAIDMRLVWPGNDNEPDNKLNRMIAQCPSHLERDGHNHYRRPDGTPFPHAGCRAAHLLRPRHARVKRSAGSRPIAGSGKNSSASASRPARSPSCRTTRRSADKQRLFNDFNAGRVRILIGSSETMGTGVNAQLRLKALHHLDVPWLPSHIEQREGRIERQGNQHDEIEIYAYATLGSMDATMWQNNERKARFIAAALSGDRSIRPWKTSAARPTSSRWPRRSRRRQPADAEGGTGGEIARLERQRAAHIDDQLNVRRQITNARSDIAAAQDRLAGIAHDLARRAPTRGNAFAMTLEDRVISDRRIAGTLLLSKVRLAERTRRVARTQSARSADSTLSARPRASPMAGNPDPETHRLRL